MTNGHQRHLATRMMLFVVLVATIGCDRVTKRFAVETLAGSPDRSFLADTVRIAYAENAGGFLNIGAAQPASRRRAIFVVGCGLLLVAVMAAALRARWTGISLLGVTFFVAGGVSNWADRVLHGTVVDFLNVGVGPIRTGIFNVADVAIMFGLALLLTGEGWRRE
jgi:signal peptidase II